LNTQQIGIIVDNLESSQLSYDIINELNSSKNNVLLFCNNPHSVCMHLNTTIMSVSEAWGFKGTIITTSASTTHLATKIITIPKILFLVWDLEFIRHNPIKNYENYASLFLNNKVELLCRSMYHADLIDNCYNRKARVIGNRFNLSKIL